MKIDILTLHPAMFAPLQSSMIGRAHDEGLISINLVNIRDYGLGKWHQVDDTPYGGGSGMVMRVDVVHKAIEAHRQPNSLVLLMDPVGTPFKEEHARSLSVAEHLIIVCGHYEGIDSRIREYFIDQAYSIGDFVLTGGELAAMVIVDATCRLISGVLGNSESLTTESFENSLLEHSTYTRPQVYLDHKVPDVLLSGHHRKIEEFRAEDAQKVTAKYRSDLLNND